MSPSILGRSLARVGDKFVNFYLIEEASRLTMIDGGLPAHLNDLEAALESMGRTFDDIDSVLITHAHPDHIGVVERVRERSGCDVFVHERDADTLRGMSSPAPPLGTIRHLRHWFFVKYVLSSFRSGIHRVGPIAGRVLTFRGEESLDVPGRPTVVHAPGHTPGSSAFRFDDHQVLVSGDSLATLSVDGSLGPDVIPKPLTENIGEARASAERLRSLQLRWLLPGHGVAWDLKRDDVAHDLAMDTTNLEEPGRHGGLNVD